MREDAHSKGMRYLVEGRLIVTKVTGDSIRAVARGDGEVFALSYERGRWSCSCPARARCSHLYALGAVVAPGTHREKGEQ